MTVNLPLKTSSAFHETHHVSNMFTEAALPDLLLRQARHSHKFCLKNVQFNITLVSPNVLFRPIFCAYFPTLSFLHKFAYLILFNLIVPILLFKRWSCPCPQNVNLYREQQANCPAPCSFIVHSTLNVDWSERYSTLPCRFSSIKKTQYPLNCGLVRPWNRPRSFGEEIIFVPCQNSNQGWSKISLITALTRISRFSLLLDKVYKS